MPKTTDDTFLPGEVATLTGVHGESIKVWRRRGFVKPANASGGWNRFTFTEVIQIAVMGDLAALGLNSKHFLDALVPQLAGLHSFKDEPAFLVIGPARTGFLGTSDGLMIFDPNVPVVEIVRASELVGVLTDPRRSAAAVVSLDAVEARVMKKLEAL